MENCSTLEAMVPTATKETKATKRAEDDKGNNLGKVKPTKEGESLAEKAKGAFNSAAEKTKEIVGQMKEKLTADEVNEDVEGVHPEEDLYVYLDEHETGDEGQLRNHRTVRKTNFSKTDELHAEQAQNIAAEHAKHD
uniref:Uncharacterized protein n=1 Tax=Plectus sambesii TaxID=2011161 RepID=A0A914XFX9_9BILA